MPKYIALLRGINVSGQKLIKMETLREALAKLPITNITTYIQSGNILFESEIQDVSTLQSSIASIINSDFGFDVPVTVITPKLLREVIDNNPYREKSLADPTQPYVSFLSELPASSALEEFRKIDFGNDTWINYNRWLYITYESAARTKLSNAVIERKLSVSSTARNWKTVQKLLELSR